MAEKHEKTATLPGMDSFKRATDEQLSRLTQMLDEAAKLQTRWFESTTQSANESGELVKSSIKYFNELSTEWRRISLEGTKKAIELIAP